jgi:hypothetical protein
MDREGTCRPTTMRSPDLAGPEDPARRDWRGKVGSLAAPKRIHGLRCQGGASYGRGLLAKNPPARRNRIRLRVLGIGRLVGSGVSKHLCLMHR